VSAPRGRSRAAEREAFVAGRRGHFDPHALAAAMAELLAEAPGVVDDEGEGPPLVGMARAFASSNVRRWVPIGPSVIRAKADHSFKRATGRVRDVQVSSDGRRAYAATAKGGVWYSDDAGGLWSPVGGWTTRAAAAGGTPTAQACGCINVVFGATVADDFVMVGTGELQGFGRPPIRPALSGLGVLAARGPAVTTGVGGDPWEPETGRGVLEGLGIFKLTRHPDATPGKTTAPNLDQVLAGTSGGLFLGVRGAAPPPHNGEFTWTLLPALEAFAAFGRPPLVTDVLWLPKPPDPRGRIVVAVARDLESVPSRASLGSGVAFSDDFGSSWHWVQNIDPTAVGAQKAMGRMSLANPESDRVYVLGERRVGAVDTPSLWRIPSVTAAAPRGDVVGNMPAVWTRAPTGKNQRDYDQALTVDVQGGVDRVYLGGNFHIVGFDAKASVWCFDVQMMPSRTLVPVTGVSRTGAPPAGDGADPAGMIGDDIHADVHNIRVAGPPGLARHVWVATDGGVYVSTQGGRANTFASRSAGLAAAEVNFHAPHPTSTHFGAIGTQDNGRHVRVGDVVWEDVMGGDGGGVAFHPVRSEIIVSQFNTTGWGATPSAGFVDPIEQGAFPVPSARESGESAFYSGTASVRLPPATGRVVIGTNRVWLSEDVGALPSNHWSALPFPSGAATNARPGGADPPARRRFGVPGGPPLAAVVGGRGPLGAVITQKWASPRELLVVFNNGLARWTQDPITLDWSAQVLAAPAGVVVAPAVLGAPDPARSTLSDVAPIPGTRDFYLVTLGEPGVATTETCLHFEDATRTFRAAELRSQLPPLDPAYAVVVDPAAPTEVYVGTATGVWRGVRGVGPPGPGLPWPHTWTPDMNGTPQTLVQDLSIWHDPAVVGAPRLLRAAMQSSGVWELDLAAATEPRRTYARVHAADDRRQLPTPMADPRQAPAAPALVAVASPDIVVRPRPSPPVAPAWRLASGAVIDELNPVEYELWTFQTAFRWLFPSVLADGRWSAALGELVKLHRSAVALPPVVAQIHEPLWNAVVRDTRVSPAGTVSANPAHGRAVYRPPWQTPAAMNAVPTEIDMLDSVRPPSTIAGIDQLFSEPSTIDVLIHHRDTRPLGSNDAFGMLLWRSDPSRALLEGLDVTPLVAYFQACATGAVPGAPAGWTRVLSGASPLHPLPVRLDARMPRAVSIDVDFTAETGKHIVIVAAVGSALDRCSTAPVGLPATPNVADLTRRWPYLAARIIKVSAR
jgi:hypothetical protein